MPRTRATRIASPAPCPIWAPLLALAFLLGPPPAPAQDAPPIPDLGREHVYALGVPDEYGPLRDEIARLERDSPQRYYVVVLRSAGPGDNATRDYLDRLVERWQAQAQAGGAPFDRARSVVIVVAIENRRIVVLGGPELQRRYGFREPSIERELLAPHFYAHARAGDYARGLRVLVGEIDRWITRRDQQLTRQAEERKALDARLRDDANAALEAGRTLRDDARKELDARKEAGPVPEGMTLRFRDGSGDLDAAAGRLDAEPGEALTLAQQGRRTLQGVLDDLRRLAARQAELDDRLQAAAQRAGEVAQAIDAAGRRGLPTGAVQRELAEATALIEQARRANRADPGRAADLASRIDNRLTDATTHIRSLPDLVRQAGGRAAAAGPQERAARAALQRAQAAGVADAELARSWADAQKQLAAAREQAAADPRRAVAAFEAAARSLQAVRDRASSALGAHRYRTRTLPALLLGGLAGAVASILAMLWYRRRRAQRALDVLFKDFRQHAVGLMERLDALRERHKTLAAADPDFTAPMAGSTLALFQAVEADLNRLWDRWLRLMEAWEQAQGRARLGSTFNARAFDEARALLKQEGDFAQITGEVESCRERLDRLNQAHERARAELEAAAAATRQLRGSLDAIRSAGLPPAAFLEAISPSETLRAQAEALVTADPVGSQELLEKAREAATALEARIGRIQAGLKRIEEVRRKADEVAAHASALRSSGWRVAEESGDPDPHLDAARRRIESALQALRAADPDAAGEPLDRASAEIVAAEEALERHRKAREAFPNDRAALADESSRLEGTARDAAGLLAELDQHFAPSSWRDLAGHLNQVRSLLEAAAERLARADEAAAPGVQAFLRAAALLDEARRRHARAGQLLAALEQRHAALTSLAHQVGEAVRSLDAERAQVARHSEANAGAIGPEATRAREAAERALRELVQAAGASRPDWPALRVQAEAVRRGLAVARKQAEADVEGLRRAAERLEQVRRRLREVESHLSREEKDRPPANQRYQAAARALAEFERDGRIEPGAWDQRLRRLDEIAADLDRAEALAAQDVSLANAAIAEISSAARAIREARAYYQAGIAVDVGPADEQLQRARGALTTQAYEQAVQRANAAEQLVREAYDRAAAEARRRRMRAEQAQAMSVPDVLVIAAAHTAASLAGQILGSIAAGAVTHQASHSDPGGGGSWGTDAPVGSPTSGADEGSW